MAKLEKVFVPFSKTLGCRVIGKEVGMESTNSKF